MHPPESDPRQSPGIGAGTDTDTAADRRRPGRQADINPQLIPLLRGKNDPDAPADPLARRPLPSALDRDLFLGAAIVSTLLLLGTLLRFIA